MELVDQEFIPVLLGGDITAYSLARSFHEEYKIKSISLSLSSSGPLANSDIAIKIVEPGLEKLETLLEALDKLAQSYPSQKLIVLGCGDWYVRALIENKDKLQDRYIIPYIDEELMNEIVLKDKFYEICEELGIDYPKTFVYDCKEKNELDFDYEYPIIAKTANSALYHYAKFEGKKKVFKLRSRDELEKMLDNLSQSSYDYKFLIQEFIPGDDSNMRVLTCYADKNSDVKFMALGHVLLEEHTPTALGNPAAIINEVNMDIFEQAKKFLKAVKYTGYANFDIKYDPRDQKYKFFEINTRLGRSNYYITGSGFNAVKYIVDDLIYGKEFGEPVIADKENLFLIVPKLVVKRYVKDKEAREKAQELMRQKKVSNPLRYKNDKNIKRRIYVTLAMINQIRKFKKYYND